MAARRATGLRDDSAAKPEREDRRRISRQRATLLRERIQHTNRVRGLLFGQGITNYNPLHKNRRDLWKNCGPETDARCQLTSRPKFFARSTGLKWYYARSARSKLSAMKCCGRQKRQLSGSITYAAQGHWCGVRQQLDRSNRSVFLEVWDTEANYIAWQGSGVTKSFVAQTTPLLGSPFDHRLNILCGEAFVDGTGCVPP